MFGGSLQVQLMDLIYLIRHTKLTCSSWISVDETLSAWRPRTTVLGGLPKISFILENLSHWVR
jgi:hypothetical protein